MTLYTRTISCSCPFATTSWCTSILSDIRDRWWERVWTRPCGKVKPTIPQIRTAVASIFTEFRDSSEATFYRTGFFAAATFFSLSLSPATLLNSIIYCTPTVAVIIVFRQIACFFFPPLRNENRLKRRSVYVSRYFVFPFCWKERIKCLLVWRDHQGKNWNVNQCAQVALLARLPKSYVFHQT